MSLRPCLQCTRHVRSSEKACPFCGTNLPAVATATPRSVAGLGRAAIMAFGTLAATAEVGCTVAPAYGGPSQQDAFIGSQDAAYGGPPPDASLSEPDAAAAAEDAATSPDAGNDAGGSVAAYGAPPEDAGGAQLDTGGGIGPLYGGAP